MSEEIKQYLVDEYKTQPDVIDNHDEAFLFVKIPENVAEIPQFSHPKKTTVEEAKEFWSSIINGDIHVMEVQGQKTALMYQRYCNCDYCNQQINDHRPYNDYYYCYTCFKDMCNLCYSETSEEIAIKNGAKNYAKRKDKLDLCLKGNHDVRVRIVPEDYYCDVCTKIFNVGDKRYTDSDIDICTKCKDTNECALLLKENGLEDSDLSVKTQQQICAHVQDIGSFLDWYLILKDQSFSIYWNWNIDSPHFKKLIVSVIDENRCGGYFYCMYSLTINSLITKLDELESYDIDAKGRKEIENLIDYCSTEQVSYNNVIYKLMKSYNMNTRVGLF